MDPRLDADGDGVVSRREWEAQRTHAGGADGGGGGWRGAAERAVTDTGSSAISLHNNEN